MKSLETFRILLEFPNLASFDSTALLECHFGSDARRLVMRSAHQRGPSHVYRCSRRHASLGHGPDKIPRPVRALGSRDFPPRHVTRERVLNSQMSSAQSCSRSRSSGHPAFRTVAGDQPCSMELRPAPPGTGPLSRLLCTRQIT